MKIKNFYGKDSEELKYDKDFEMNCIFLSQYTNQSVKDATVKEYFSLMKYADDKQKKAKKSK